MSFPIVGAAGMPVPVFEVDGPHIEEEEGRGSKALCFCGLLGSGMWDEWLCIGEGLDFFDFFCDLRLTKQ